MGAYSAGKRVYMMSDKSYDKAGDMSFGTLISPYDIQEYMDEVYSALMSRVRNVNCIDQRPFVNPDEVKHKMMLWLFALSVQFDSRATGFVSSIVPWLLRNKRDAEAIIDYDLRKQRQNAGKDWEMRRTLINQLKQMVFATTDEEYEKTRNFLLNLFAYNDILPPPKQLDFT